MFVNSQFKSALKKSFPTLLESDADELLSISQIKKFKNKDILFKEGQKVDKIYYTLGGMARAFKYDKLGEEKTIFLRPKNTFAPPTILGSRAIFNAGLVGSGHLLEIKISDFEELRKQNSNINELWIEVLKEIAQTFAFRIFVFVEYPPEERYQMLIEKFPEFLDLASNKYIANLLGITPNSLSRIRQRILKKGK